MSQSMSFGEMLDLLISRDDAAASAVTTILQTENKTHAVAILNNLDDWNIRGANIWYCLHDICKGDVELMYEKVKDGTLPGRLEEIPYAKYSKP